MARPPLVPPGPELTAVERTQYARHLLLPGLGAQGQRSLRAARVCVVGAGGLGSPVLLYLAAAGVGTLGIVDDDVVDVTNLQRQVVHGVGDVGRAKVDSAADAVAAVNPRTRVERHRERLEADGAAALLADYDLVVDGADNFPTRYLVGDACARLGIPHVWGSVYRFDGQVSVWWAGEGPCYACVFPSQPPPEAAPSCSVGGVLGSVCASIGSVMATEAVKVVTGTGEPLVGRLLVHDALRQTWDAVPVRADPGCRVCGSGADATRPLGWSGAVASADTAPGDEAQGRPGVDVVRLAELLAAREAGSESFVLLDVREPGELEVAVIPGGEHVVLDRIRAGEPVPGAGGRVYVYCKVGGRSAEAVDLLRARGVDAVDVLGGVLAWSRDVDPSVPTY